MTNETGIDLQSSQDSNSLEELIFKRFTIIVDDNVVYIDGEPYSEIDLSWIPKYNGIDVHAVQWNTDRGEIELKNSDPNIIITDLEVFKSAIDQWKIKKLEAQRLEEQRLEEQRLFQEREDQMEESLQFQLAGIEKVDEDLGYYSGMFDSTTTIEDIDIENLLSQI